MVNNKVLGIEEIKQLLPHRHPFLLIDRVENIVPGESCTAYKNVSYDAWYFQGHFPNYPIMPGVLIIESMAQAAGVLALYSIDKKDKTDSVLFASINEAKFKHQVVPGDTLRIEVKVVQKRSKIWKFEAEAYIKDINTSQTNKEDVLADTTERAQVGEHRFSTAAQKSLKDLLADTAVFTAIIP